MEFKKLVLNNIGPYKDYNQFTFDTVYGKNTIIIGGKNGSGKTTFLNGLRLALYGPTAYGYKTETKEYLTKVSSLLNSQALDNPNSQFYIQMELIMEENFKKNYINITRRWEIKNSNIKEKVTIIRNQTLLDDIQKENFFEYLRTSFPPSLLDLCFFDGEDIYRLSNDDLLSEYLSELSMRLFNLDLFKNLENDMLAYRNQKIQENTEKKLENEKNSIEKEFAQKSMELNSTTDQLNELESKLIEKEEIYKKIKKEFSIHGGLAYKEREYIQKEILLIENKRKETNDQIKDFISKYLPFFIALPILKNLLQQLEDEENYFLSSFMVEKINKLSIQELFSVIDLNFPNDQEKQFRDKLIEQLIPPKEVNVIHNASKSEAHQVQSIFSLVNIEHLNQFINLIEQNKDDLQHLYQLKQRLKDNENTVEFQDMIIEMEKLNTEILNIKSSIEILNSSKNNILNELNDYSKRLKKVNDEIYRLIKKKASFIETEKIINISRRYQEKQLRKKLQDAEYFSTYMFKNLLRKKQFVSRILINPQSFNITLIDHDNKIINKDILSAGEKELLILSIIWGTIKASKKQLPFVLDTLLGRLDLEHKHSVITKLVPNFGKQIIILSTDSELDEKLYLESLPFTSNEYTLNYDTSKKQTFIENHYFNYNDKKGGIKNEL